MHRSRIFLIAALWGAAGFLWAGVDSFVSGDDQTHKGVLNNGLPSNGAPGNGKPDNGVVDNNTHSATNLGMSSHSSGGGEGKANFSPVTVKSPVGRAHSKQATGLIKGSEEIHTDKYGRIKTQFNWDRNGKKDGGNGGVTTRLSDHDRNQISGQLQERQSTTGQVSKVSVRGYDPAMKKNITGNGKPGTGFAKAEGLYQAKHSQKSGADSLFQKNQSQKGNGLEKAKSLYKASHFQKAKVDALFRKNALPSGTSADGAARTGPGGGPH